MMAKAKTEQAKSAFPSIQRLLEDEFVHEQLRSAASGVREAYSRARAERDEAVEDKRLYSSLRKAAVSLRTAARTLQGGQPEPKRRTRKAMPIVLAVGGCAWLTARLQKLHRQQKAAAARPFGATA